MTTNGDRELREIFAALRDEDAASSPPLSRVLRRMALRPPARASRWIPTGVLATAAVIIAVVLASTPRTTQPSIEDAIAQARSMFSWTAPTDAWLTMPDLEIPNSVPSLSLSSVALPEVSTSATATGELR